MAKMHFIWQTLLKYSDFLAHSEILPTAFHVKADFSPSELKENN